MFFVLGLVVGASTVGMLVQVVVPWRQAVALAACKGEQNDALTVECIFRVIENELTTRGVTSATEVFARAYREFPAFVRGACHVHAHRLGDLTYYQVYVGHEDFDSIEFPQATTACGYGFFHGFLEHLIQDHPDPAFVTKTCDYLTRRLGKDMGSIEMTCYHGSGHGFMLAQSERVPRAQWGDVQAFSTVPLTQCEALAEADKLDLEQCKEGVFNVLDEWAAIGQNGFSLDSGEPFALCAHVPEPSLKACYYEMAQKIDYVAQLNPQLLVPIVQKVPQEYALMAFNVGVAGIVQNVIANPGGYQNMLAQCATLNSTFAQPCLISVVKGLFEHGEPQEEYKKALLVCTDPIVTEGEKKYCYEAVADKLDRFYVPERVREICGEFPLAYREACLAANEPFIDSALN